MHFNTKPSFFARFDIATIAVILSTFFALAFANC